jgi:hypothetical protein
LANEKGEKIPYDWFEYLKKSKNFVSPGIDDKELLREFREAVKVANNFVICLEPWYA